MKARKVITIPPTLVYGPRIAAELQAGNVVEVAGFLLRLKAEDVTLPAFELTA